MKKFFVCFAAILCLFTSCKSGKTLLPNVSGKAGEVIVVMEKADWEGALGVAVRELLASDCPYLAQKEPLYSLVSVTPSAFGDLLKIHRNILFFSIDPQGVQSGVKHQRDVWATPQCVVSVRAADSKSALELVGENGGAILSAIEQAERDRVIRNSILFEEKSLGPAVTEEFGGALHFPIGYKLKKKTSDFVWVADEKQYTMQGVFVYKYPFDGSENPFEAEQIISHRNEILKANVPGLFENTWMTTGIIIPPTVEFIKYQGQTFAQTRGYWEVENDFMGGPFVSHSFYSKDGKDIIVLEAFVYAPKFDKRQYLRQVESILFSWEWKETEK